MNSDFNLEAAAEEWCKKIKAVPAFTESDSEEFKYNLLDLADDLKSKGLDHQEAFMIASKHYNHLLNLQDEIGEENAGWLQMRRITQVLAGILVYFFLFYFMHLTSKFLFFELIPVKGSPFPYLKYVYYYLIFFHLLLVVAAVVLYFFGKRIISPWETHTLKPVYALAAFLCILGLAIIDHRLFSFIHNLGILSRFYIINDYSNFTFSFVFILCFIFLYKKYYVFSFLNQEVSAKEAPVDYPGEESWKDLLLEDQIQNLEKIGLDEKEIVLIGLKRKGIKLPVGSVKREETTKASWRALLIILSGVLVYFLTYYFMHGTSRMMFSILQFWKHDPDFSVRWTWFYVGSFHLLVVFFATSLYIRDFQLIRILRKINIKPSYTMILFISTIVFEFADRYFRGVSRIMIWESRPIYHALERIFVVSQFSFPLLTSICFLVLFFKYYKENVKTV